MAYNMQVSPDCLISIPYDALDGTRQSAWINRADFDAGLPYLNTYTAKGKLVTMRKGRNRYTRPMPLAQVAAHIGAIG